MAPERQHGNYRHVPPGAFAPCAGIPSPKQQGSPFHNGYPAELRAGGQDTAGLLNSGVVRFGDRHVHHTYLITVLDLVADGCWEYLGAAYVGRSGDSFGQRQLGVMGLPIPGYPESYRSPYHGHLGCLLRSNGAQPFYRKLLNLLGGHVDFTMDPELIASADGLAGFLWRGSGKAMLVWITEFYASRPEHIVGEDRHRQNVITSVGEWTNGSDLGNWGVSTYHRVCLLYCDYYVY